MVEPTGRDEVGARKDDVRPGRRQPDFGHGSNRGKPRDRGAVRLGSFGGWVCVSVLGVARVGVRVETKQQNDGRPKNAVEGWGVRD